MVSPSLSFGTTTLYQDFTGCVKTESWLSPQVVSHPLTHGTALDPRDHHLWSPYSTTSAGFSSTDDFSCSQATRIMPSNHADFPPVSSDVSLTLLQEESPGRFFSPATSSVGPECECHSTGLTMLLVKADMFGPCSASTLAMKPGPSEMANSTFDEFPMLPSGIAQNTVANWVSSEPMVVASSLENVSPSMSYDSSPNSISLCLQSSASTTYAVNPLVDNFSPSDNSTLIGRSSQSTLSQASPLEQFYTRSPTQPLFSRTPLPVTHQPDLAHCAGQLYPACQSVSGMLALETHIPVHNTDDIVDRPGFETAFPPLVSPTRQTLLDDRRLAAFGRSAYSAAYRPVSTLDHMDSRFHWSSKVPDAAVTHDRSMSDRPLFLRYVFVHWCCELPSKN